VQSDPQEKKLALIMVGLPARGKSFTARKLERYLTWLGYDTRVFNLGQYRRERFPGYQPHDFFDPDNVESSRVRNALAVEALDDMLEWLVADGDVAIYDATNTTRERRALVSKHCEEHGVRHLFVETVCDDPEIIEDNIRATKVGSPDYAGHDPDEAVIDFRKRISHYARAYVPVEDDEGPYVRLIDIGRLVVMHDIEGYLPGRVVTFLMNLNHASPPVWLTRHGESISNVQAKIGGDSDLAPRGHRYARSLAGTLIRSIPDYDELTVWTSSLRRTIQTAAQIERPRSQWRALDEIEAGLCDGMSYREIRAAMPDEYQARGADKFHYRYPRGESYQDVIQRLVPVVVEMERCREPLLIVAHQAVVRLLYAYLMGIPPQQAPHLEIPLHTLIQLTPHAYGCNEERTPLAPPVPKQQSSS
jgi:broad specificity phosphatase PhoE/predicted kinase